MTLAVILLVAFTLAACGGNITTDTLNDNYAFLTYSLGEFEVVYSGTETVPNYILFGSDVSIGTITYRVWEIEYCKLKKGKAAYFYATLPFGLLFKSCYEILSLLIRVTSI